MAFLILDIETVLRVSIDDSVAKAYLDGNIMGVEEYVMKDVEATHQLYEKLKIYIT